MPSIYILKLEHNKWYVGKTDNEFYRFGQHIVGEGAVWTSLHKPIELVNLHRNCDRFDEDKYTKQMMGKHGIDNVRGGSYTQVVLDDDTMAFLQRELDTADDACFRCGRTGHFANKCYAKTDVHGNPIKDEDEDEEDDEYVYQCGDCGREFDTEYACMRHKCQSSASISNSCFRCGRLGHYANGCYARYHINGYKLNYEN